ncbi:uncharacterized protein L3040_005673 [Drepanopeziza brunnea f. sp. 'multigermtubi']|uniref:RRM domain-containing protein n=1 Tax=Marssonina brunnea f. sp. multigermtubi (strain MB_m1) TaxID=1072389 RepID=K1WN12_MARBU|nr:uncharacterized protein MBM_07908 [Drepanopeziza brunnea f. sp. 'multigermtubi' MB_m1]EKD13707.1 hypothetical protein MBM_07908 [Drepanopeziza brunnea f. sp. 'multigermtubi' MB_m1]KAJ5041119.1 hypothetical protein L3040_005673 [Drepanopeziza brunnea f. sp. 'multigermtubi']
MGFPEETVAKLPKGPSSKSKKEKSSKKRKAETLVEPTPQNLPTEPATTEAKGDIASPVASTEPAEDASSEPPIKKRKAIDVDEIEVDIAAPVPPSKKELRRLKKGKPLPASKTASDPTAESKEKEKKAEVEKRSEHGVWIGNMPFFVSKDDLRKFLVEQSDLTDEDITRIHMPGPNDKKSANKVEEKRFGKVVHNKGFAYVDFSTAEGVTHALELSEELLSGRRVLIKEHTSFEGRPERTKASIRQEGKPPSTRVFLGNLSFDTTEESLTQHFEKCGAIASIKIATFEDSGKCKGYAWIVFEELSAAESAVKGFVYIREEKTDVSEPDESDEDSDPDGVTKSKPKQVKTRKWWVNKIKGRPLRMEFAEDAQVRYKKRYGKGGTKGAPSDGAGAGARKPTGEEPKSRPIVAKTVEYFGPDYGPRVTGGIVASEGKKVIY